MSTTREIDLLRSDLEAFRSSMEQRFEHLEIKLEAAITDAVRGSEHRILVWMFNTVVAAVLGGTAISVAVALNT